MSDTPHAKQLLEQEQALSTYLTDMLSEAQVLESESTEPVVDSTHREETISPEQSATATEVQEQAKIHSIATEAPIQVLLLQLHGLRLAISVQDLSGILKWPEQPMSKMPGKPDWYMGVISNPQQYIQVIDIGHILLPEQTTETLESKYIVLIDDNRWGLACESVSKVTTVQPEDVKWRQQSGQRKWLAGTLLGEMYSIIDVTELANLLNYK